MSSPSKPARWAVTPSKSVTGDAAERARDLPTMSSISSFFSLSGEARGPWPPPSAFGSVSSGATPSRLLDLFTKLWLRERLEVVVTSDCGDSWASNRHESTSGDSVSSCLHLRRGHFITPPLLLLAIISQIFPDL